ncbi:hypothetical protein GCM10022280_18100 [Sphingomonas swuensis]|uniref:Uncharacterized protein n=1 Tax=Sphingomonas swuensis TaxID=977800 RepID=A0ABP7SZK0_9SPHN
MSPLTCGLTSDVSKATARPPSSLITGTEVALTVMKPTWVGPRPPGPPPPGPRSCALEFSEQPPTAPASSEIERAITILAGKRAREPGKYVIIPVVGPVCPVADMG